MNYKLTKRRKIATIVVISVILLGIILLTLKLLPFFISLNDAEARRQFEESIKEMGIFGVITLCLIQVFQIIVAFLPGEPIEVVAGITYGTFGGLIICLVASLIGSVIVFWLVRIFGYPLVRLWFPEEKLKRLAFLKDTKKLEIITLTIFLIPGTPKDIITYFAGLTTIKPTRFLLIATLARIPSIITSTLAGSVLGDGKIVLSVVIFAVTGLICLGGIYINSIILRKNNSNKKDESIVIDN